MKTIYKPKGRAGEYSPLAINHYNGCDHACVYCYNKANRFLNFTEQVTAKKDFITSLKKDCQKEQYRNSKNQVQLSFVGDPYCKANDELKLTRQVLEILLDARIPVSILTKGGERCLQDMDIFKKFGKSITIGASITIRSTFNKNHEPGAASTNDRIATLRILHDNGIKTWVSIEPIISIDSAKNIIQRTACFVGHYKIGTINHFDNISTYGNDYDIVFEVLFEELEKGNSNYYIKQDFFDGLSRKNQSLLNDDSLNPRLFDAEPFDAAQAQGKLF